MKYERCMIVDHPLVQHKLSILRDKNTPSSTFRNLVKEVALFEGYEATKHILLKDVEIETPLQKTKAKQMANEHILIVPIIRAGLAFVDGLLELVPTASVGHLGMYRDPETHMPVPYFDKMPSNLTSQHIIVVDPMLATGGSMNNAIAYLRERGVKSTIKIMVLVASPQGIEAVLNFDNNVEIVTCAIDDGLDENAYILPGLGDAGDRIYGTK